MSDKNIKTLRAFIALDVSEHTKQQCVEICSALSKNKLFKHIKWTPKEKMHVTLQFLDQIDVTIIPELTNKIKDTIFNFKPVQIEWNHILPFPPKRPVVIALTARLNNELAQLAAVTNQISKALGLRTRTRPFLPHLTIGRSKTPIHCKPDQLNMTLPKNEETKIITLYESKLTQDGSEYIPLNTITLA